MITANTYGADGLVSSRRSGVGAVCYLFDERGSVSQRTNSTGAVTGSEIYDAYGTRTGTASQPDPFGYEAQAGYYTDIETGLILCTHRFYDPANGRWLTRDPIGYNGGINLYGYVRNNPSNRIDPSGYLTNGGWLGTISTIEIVVLVTVVVIGEVGTGGLASPVFLLLTPVVAGAIGGLVTNAVDGKNPVDGAEDGAQKGLLTGIGACGIGVLKARS